MTTRRSFPAAGSLALLALLALFGLCAVGVSPSQAQQAGPLSNGDGKQPIEITSDTLTVEQQKQLATFSGNVDAVQGDLKLRADRLLVHYARQGGALQDGTRQGSDGQSGASADPAGQSIRKIEAFGSVVLTSPTENAQGRQGVYDVVGGTMQLTGDVILTRGDNVIRGDRLDMDLNSGVSKVSANQKSDRVRALFAPGKPAP